MNLGQLQSLRVSLPTAALLVAALAFVYLATVQTGSVVLSQFVTRMFIYLVVVVGLQVFMGNTNILWFPHIGFMGIGAYVSAICSMAPSQKAMTLTQLYPVLADLHMPFLPAILIGALTAAVIASVVCFPLMRLSDFPVVITGFALFVIINVVLTHWKAITNGPQTLFGVDQFTDLKTAAIWAALVVFAACIFRDSKIGLQLRASRDDPISAGAVGINMIKARWMALVLSAFMAGLGGGLFAHFITSFTPKAFFLTETFVVLTMLVVGGPATVTGAVVGTLIVTGLYQGLRWVENTINLTQAFGGNIAGLTDTALSIGLILVLIRRPAGLVAHREFGRHSSI
jgi:branched-chain amino acid transport system permease protein